MPQTVPYGSNDKDVKTFGNVVGTLATGSADVIDARGMTIVTIITAAASTATISRVDSLGAVADSADAAGNASVAVATKLSVAVDWPFYRIAAGGTGSIRFACV